MTLNRSVSAVVRPNTLSNEMAPNTFRPRNPSGVPTRTLGSMSSAPPSAVEQLVSKLRLPAWPLVAAIALGMILAFFLLNPGP